MIVNYLALLLAAFAFVGLSVFTYDLLRGNPKAAAPMTEAEIQELKRLIAKFEKHVAANTPKAAIK